MAKLKNRRLIKEIDNLLKNYADDNGMLDFLEDVVDETKYPHTVKLDLLRKESKEGVYRANVASSLNQLRHYLKKYDLEDIIIYGPNEHMNGWLVTNTPISFTETPHNVGRR